MSIEKTLREQIHASFNIARFAIHAADIRNFNLPPLRVKPSDSRSAGFLRNYGPDCVELDALPPNELRRRIDYSVRAMMDQAKWNHAIEVEKAEMASIMHSVEMWNNLPPMPPA
jgi:hypothetical protein